MRRLALIISFGLLIVALGATAASAAKPTHILKETFSDSFSAPAGTLCDFNFSQSFTIVDTGVFFDDESFVISETAYVTNTNVDTGYALTEVVHNTLHLDTSKGTFKQAGLFVQLRDASRNSCPAWTTTGFPDASRSWTKSPACLKVPLLVSRCKVL